MKTMTELKEVSTTLGENIKKNVLKNLSLFYNLKFVEFKNKYKYHREVCLCSDINMQNFELTAAESIFSDIQRIIKDNSALILREKEASNSSEKLVLLLDFSDIDVTYTKKELILEFLGNWAVE